jgi:cytochrome b561
VFFSHNESANSVFQPTYQYSRTEPMFIWWPTAFNCDAWIRVILMQWASYFKVLEVRTMYTHILFGCNLMSFLITLMSCHRICWRLIYWNKTGIGGMSKWYLCVAVLTKLVKKFLHICMIFRFGFPYKTGQVQIMTSVVYDIRVVKLSSIPIENTCQWSIGSF